MKTHKLTLLSIFIMFGAMFLAADVNAVIADNGHGSSTSALDGSFVQVIDGQVYHYSLSRSGSGRYDEFWLVTDSTVTEMTATMDFDFTTRRVESSDDFDLYYQAGARITDCSSSLCNTYDDASLAGGQSSESITVVDPTPGEQHFRVQRYSGGGREYFYFQVVLTYGGTPGDVTPPTVTITFPSAGATVSGTVGVTANAADDTGVDRVEFRVDGALKATDTTSPYSFNWDTTTQGNGAATITADAFDAAGNSATDSVGVTVDNQGPPPPAGCSETPRVVGSMPFWNDAIDVEKAHAAGCYGGDSVVVILDTGLNGATYPSLFPAGSVNTQYSASYTKIGGFDNIDWNGDTTEGHGTSVTSTILGYNVPSSWGFTNNYAQGVAPNAEVVMFRVVFWVGGAVSYADMINNWALAINDAVALHTSNAYFQGRGMVISMSLGYDPSLGGSANANLEAAIQNARANGVVVSTSAGNDGPSPNTTGYPANINDATSVAAAGWSGFTGNYGVAGIIGDIPEDNFAGLLIADFSSRGKIEITGMGWQLALPSQDGGIYYISGTSFSAPQVSGVFALMFGFYGGTTSVDFLESAMMNGAYNGPNGSSGSMSATTWGAGFVQADGALGL